MLYGYSVSQQLNRITTRPKLVETPLKTAASEDTFNWQATLAAGGAGRVAFMQYCVRSVTPEPLFLFVAGEYRFRPSHHSALAIYDVFCAVDSPARIRFPDALAPKELRLAATINELRSQVEPPAGLSEDEKSRLGQIPPRLDLFGHLAGRVAGSREGPLAELARRYDPSLTPDQNLPGRRMNANQRFFRDKVWGPLIRPRLVSAGFWQLGSID